jgi:hypothetical protein
MIIGAHAVIYSTDAHADRAFLKDVLHLDGVDVGEGWLIFSLPPAELAVHPSQKNDIHELYLMCDDVQAFLAEMQEHGVSCGPVQEQPWGLLTQVTLPGGGTLGVYQPRHRRPEPVSKVKKKPARRATRAPARKKPKPRRRRG